SSFPLRQLYWRRRGRIPDQPTPDSDGCGAIACSPTVLFRGRDVHEITTIVDQLFERHGFEPNVTLICAGPRHIDMVVLVVYDREVPGEDERAMALHDELLAAVCERGYYPYRLGVQSMDALPESQGDYAYLQTQIRAALDPAGILAPGRYDFESKRSDQHKRGGTPT
ncbi:MAG: hypothetical protein KC431_29150, partial [Myxococcales bacterium]|nr:hypothetical protein [Myxococcales bacterium]